MAALYKKELFVWYVVTLKLRETVESRIPSKSICRGKIVPDHEPRAPESEWVVFIEQKLEQFCQDNLPVSSAKHSIYRFPHYLKYGDDKAWVPQIASLGPYHHGEEHLRHMERHKWRCLHRILERSNQKIGLYLHSVKKVERRARACYEGTISMSRDEFVEMMVLDGCFVIELLLGFSEGFEKLGYPRKDPVFSFQESMLQIQRDMIMLENQIPLFILDRLLGLQLGEPNQKGRVAKLAIQFFNPLLQPHMFRDLWGKHPLINLKYDPLYDHGRVHCLEAFQRDVRSLGLRWFKIEGKFNIGQKLTPCLAKLRQAGIKIRATYKQFNFLDIQFEEGIGTLMIPRIGIHEGTRSLFLNLIAFGQSHFGCRDHITSYVIFMHNLINSPEDVRFLREHYIIDHSLGTDAEVADLFNQLCRGLAFDGRYSYLYRLGCDLDLYCNSKTFSLIFSRRARLAQKWNAWRAMWKAWRALLVSKYFDNPWSIISFIAASILLVLSFIQALYAVYGYYRPLS